MRDVSEVLELLGDDKRSLMVEWVKDPVLFASDVLRMEAQEWQAEWWRSISLARRGKLDKRRFAIRSGTGVGKTAGVACLILWHLAVFADSKIPCTAPTSPQIKAVLWPELRKWVYNIPEELREHFPFDVTSDMVKMGDTNFAVARTAQKERPEAFQGFHSGNIMLIADEASGVPDEIFAAGDGVMAQKGALTVLIGNPTRASGFFYDAFNGDEHLYWTRRVSCMDSPFVDESYWVEKERKYGKDSYDYCVRILGEFFLLDDNLIIARPYMDAARDRGKDIKVDTDYVVWGFDPSDGGRDNGALAFRQGNVLPRKTLTFKGMTSDRQVDAVVDEFYKSKVKPNEIIVDAIGVGTNCYRMLRRELGDRCKITPLYVGAPATDARYASIRVELWGRAREWARSDFCSIHAWDEELMRQLCSVEWEISETNGKYKIPDKKVDGKSPNNADAFLLTFASTKARRSSVLTTDKKYVTMKPQQKMIGSSSWLN